MQVNSIKPSIEITPTIDDTSAVVSESMIGFKIVSLMQGFCGLLIIVGLIVGIIYMIKSKKTKGKRILIGAIIIVVPFILNWILNIVKVNMLLNM